MLKSEDAGPLRQNGDRYREPPRAPPMYCYVGMGVGRQPECITGMVVSTKSAELTDAVVFPSDVPAGMTVYHIAIGEQPWVKGAMQEPASHISSMWVPWGDVGGSCANT